MHFVNISLFIPFILLSSMGDYHSSLHFTIVWFYTFVSCVEFKFQLFILTSNLVLGIVLCYPI
jgi:hypothetical protein